MNLLETYLRELYQTHSTGLAVKETSYYGALSYRELGLLGRPLTHHEARYVTQMARRSMVLLLSSALDANYDAVKTVWNASN